MPPTPSSADPVPAEALAGTFAAPWPGHDGLRITGVRTVATAPEGIPLVVVVVETSDPGLVGYGCATFTQRWRAVTAYVEHLTPLLLGRHPGDIGDLVRLARNTGYWREGPVGNNAVSGVDMALWDLAGKRAGLPVHQLVGGRVRAAADTYLHAAGPDVPAALAEAERLLAAGYRNVRLQVGQDGVGAYGAPGRPGGHPRAPYPDGWRVEDYLTGVPRLFAAARERLGESVGLLHDVHSRLDPKRAVLLARSLEEFGLFFLEDVLAPEFWDRLPEVRAASPVPLAVGELATSLTDAARLVTGGGVDLLRCHVSAVGGFSAARKLAVLAELHGVRTAWHGPGDTSPVGAAANVTLDVTSEAFGIQEAHEFDERAQEVFPGTLLVADGWLKPSDAPGWGVGLDERAAARYPAGDSLHDRWAAGVRAPDGALAFP
ncbi:enolase C-terminal domain-like protein [Kineococcus rhizosphaerae]|uniref:Mannonate dehydratase n=1 Tax=Kineococcus rhizosphaerae TaxID=559628 RepID=A0A2T0R8S4_9ACTN|nr:enolase C-terminal domain-like protein [Kineococcus rhizosphaerae]PRY17567.1 mannonate dehydratase [Kineococcus rhizosphaerae]